MSDPTTRPTPEQSGTLYQPPDTGGMQDDVEAGPIDEGEDIDEGTPIDEGVDADPEAASR
jgi:hypothetical protein